MTWALASHYFPLAYLALGPALRVLDVRMEEAARRRRALPPRSSVGSPCHCCVPRSCPPCCSCSSWAWPLRGAPPDRPARPHRRVHHRHPGRHHRDPAGVRGRERARPHSARDLRAGVFFYRRATRNAELLRHHHRPRLSAHPGEASGAGAGRSRSGWARCSPSRSGCRSSRSSWQSFFRNLAQPFFSSAALATLDNYDFILRYPIFLAAVKTSVLLAAMAATIVAGLTFIMAWIAQRSLPRYGFILDALAFAPIAIPGVIVGAGILVAYLMLPIPIYNTIWIPLGGLRHPLPSLRHALRVEWDHADPSRARGDGVGIGREPGPDLRPDHAAAFGPGAAAGWFSFSSCCARAPPPAPLSPPPPPPSPPSPPPEEGGGRAGGGAALGLLLLLLLLVFVFRLPALRLRPRPRAPGVAPPLSVRACLLACPASRTAPGGGRGGGGFGGVWGGWGGWRGF